MPLKIRELKAMLRAHGFEQLKGRGKGSHCRYSKKGVKGVITLCGHDGDDAPKYLEKQVLKAIN